MTRQIRNHPMVSMLALGLVTLSASGCSSSLEGGDSGEGQALSSTTQEIHIAVPGTTEASCEVMDQTGNTYLLEQAPGKIAVQTGGGALNVECSRPGFRTGRALVEAGAGSGDTGFFAFDQEDGEGSNLYPAEVTVAMIRDASSPVGSNALSDNSPAAALDTAPLQNSPASAGFDPDAYDPYAAQNPYGMPGEKPLTQEVRSPVQSFGADVASNDNPYEPSSAVPGLRAPVPVSGVNATGSQHLNPPAVPGMQGASNEVTMRRAQGDALMGDNGLPARGESLGTLEYRENGQVVARRNGALPASREAALNGTPASQGQPVRNASGATAYAAPGYGSNATPAAQQQPVRTASAAYSVQVGAYRDQGNAEKMMSRLRNSGLDPFSIEGRGGLTQVRVGSFQDRRSAMAAAQTIRDHGIEAVPVRN